MILILFVNIYLAYINQFEPTNVYTIFLILQVVFYLFVIMGRLLTNKSIRLKSIFLPYYLFIMNYAAIMGGIRYFKGSQSVNWERAKRAKL